MPDFVKGSWTVKAGGILVLAIVGWVVEQILNNISSVVAKMSLADKLYWGIPVFLLFVGIFLLFSPAIEKWIHSLGDKKKEIQDPERPKVQYVAHMERVNEENILLKQENTLLKQENAEIRKQTPPVNENKINTNEITLSVEAIGKSQKWLDEIINQGEDLVYNMKTPGFNWAQLELWVQRWLIRISKEAWDVLHQQYAAYVTQEQGNYTSEEVIKYGHWSTREGSLRIMVDRKLLRLREIRAKFQ